MADRSNPVNWFEIPAVDLERAKKFYEGVFSLKLTPQDMGFVELAFFPEMVNDSYGITGALVKGKNFVPSHNGTRVYFSVPDIEAILAKVDANGGKTIMPRTGIGQYGFIATFEDTEGNLVALHSMG
jgi:predicted enzyme related to lactoylglutathione lyase